MLTAIRLLLDLFLASCQDRETLQQLRHMVDHESEWVRAHDLFARIRRKTLAAESADDHAADCQYLFEEVCAKSLYNLSGCSDPFDEDSPFYILPCALSLARALSIPDTTITHLAVP
ncbi:MAG: hypothetical protein INR62_12375 [Rhodospirillales bacterium]|nr:hypothetical protein [Acetobacter sp.]